MGSKKLSFINQIIFILFPCFEFGTLLDELSQVVIRKHPLWIGVLSCDWILEAVLLEVFLSCILLERMAAREDYGVCHDFLSKRRDT